MTQQALTSNLFSQSSRPISAISNCLETECRRDDESGGLRALLGRGVVRFWQAVRRTVGKATTFWTRFKNLPWEYCLSTRNSSWGLVRGSVGSGVEGSVSGTGEGFSNRFENSLRE